MRRFFYHFLIASVLLTSCSIGQTPSLWGTYSTPTSEFFPTSYFPSPAAATPSPTSTYIPSATIPATRTLTVLQTPTISTPTQGTSDSSVIESTLTPTFDVASTLYYAQSGDTLPALEARFNVKSSEIRADTTLPPTGLISPGTLLVIADRITGPTTPNLQIIPDSEMVFSATAINFDIAAYIAAAKGYLSQSREYLNSTGWISGPDEIKSLAYDNSINPRLLLALLDYESRWVHGQPVDILHIDFPMGYQNDIWKGMWLQMVWAVNQLSIGYYGWRTGSITTLTFPDGTHLRLDPRLNAGTVAIQYLFSQVHNQSQWAQMIDPNNGFPAVYTQQFGDPWARGATVDPLFPPGLSQPILVLPFQRNVEWNYTGGPHGAWEHDGSLAAVDFAPSTDHGGCDPTPTWITAAAPGLIVRSARGEVVEDLDGDGYEQTGWDLVYLHVATLDRVPAGTYVQTNDHIGHASCEGGIATGTHLHFVRKYNGEWVAADGPIPFVIGGWTVHQGALPYVGTLTRGNQTIFDSPVGELKSVIIRLLDDP